MRTLAQKPKATQQTTSSKSTKPSRAFLGQSRDVESILHLQRTIGNQAVLRLLQTETENINTSSASSTSTGFTNDFSRIPVYPSTRNSIQPKLKFNDPGDEYEQEADQVADRVLKQNIPEEENKSGVQGQPSIIAETEGHSINEVLENRISRSKGSGNYLSDETRAFFEPRLMHDFSGVRVHTDSEAACMNRELKAQAFTSGQDIYFGVCQYNFQSNEGKRLLAHELTHVMQQLNHSPLSLSANSGTITASKRPALISDQLIQRRILIGSRVMDEDERSGFVQAVRDRALMARNRAHCEILISHPRATERLLHELSSASTDYRFHNQTELIGHLADSITAETPTEEESRELAGITELARLPHRAHLRWLLLNSGQRGAVLWEMGRRYGPEFAQQFRQYADAGRFEDIVEYTNMPVRLSGFQFAGTGYAVGLLGNHELWVQPSGRRIEFFPSASVGETERLTTLTTEEGVQEQIEIPDDPVTVYGPVVAQSSNFRGTASHARLFANGTIVEYFAESDYRLTFVPIPGSGQDYKVYNEEGYWTMERIDRIDIYTEFPDYLAEELGITE